MKKLNPHASISFIRLDSDGLDEARESFISNIFKEGVHVIDIISPINQFRDVEKDEIDKPGTVLYDVETNEDDYKKYNVFIMSTTLYKRFNTSAFMIGFKLFLNTLMDKENELDVPDIIYLTMPEFHGYEEELGLLMLDAMNDYELNTSLFVELVKKPHSDFNALSLSTDYSDKKKKKNKKKGRK